MHRPRSLYPECICPEARHGARDPVRDPGLEARYGARDLVWDPGPEVKEPTFYEKSRCEAYDPRVKNMQCFAHAEL